MRKELDVSVIAAIAAWNMLAFAALFFLAQIIAREAEYLAGRRYGANMEREGVGILVTAILGLMGFVLALTLSYSNTRFAERRAGTLAEANAIGTAWLRAGAIDDPRAAEVARLLASYADVRAEFVRAANDPDEIEQLNTRTSALQNEMWGHAAALSRQRPDPIIAALMSALNDTFDTSAAERFAFAFTLPPALFVLLSGMAVLSMAAVGFQLGLRTNPHRFLSVVLTVIWTLLLIQIFDLASPRVGALRTNTAIYDWTIQGFKGGVTIPPAPGTK